VVLGVSAERRSDVCAGLLKALIEGAWPNSSGESNAKKSRRISLLMAKKFNFTTLTTQLNFDSLDDVLWEFSVGLDWGRVQPEAAKFTQVCSYDPSEIGWSDDGPKDSCVWARI
jgi:hypothetical protein